MLLARSPLRISLGGGGTDLPSYYRRSGGFVISAAINKYVYISAHRTFESGIKLKYSTFENVDSIIDIKHPLFRESLLCQSLDISKNLEITSISDVPSGTGLGSSGAFTVALLKVLKHLQGLQVSNEALAQQACHIEIERIGDPVGKQDQYISAIGGVTQFHFNEDDSVDYSPLSLAESTFYNLEDSLCLFYTGSSRSAASVLMDQHIKTSQEDAAMLSNLDRVKELGYTTKELLEAGNTFQYGLLMNDHWQTKIQRNPQVCDQRIKDAYSAALNNGAVGGKLVGAGGGGFLLFLASDKSALRSCMTDIGFPELRFSFDRSGAQLVYS